MIALAVLAAGIVTFRTSIVADQDRGYDAVARAQMTYPYDVKDKRMLVGASDNVFVGRVVEQVGAKPLDAVGGEGVDAATADIAQPRTQFSVEVLRNIKGRLSGTVTVSQDGGVVEYKADKDYPEAGVRAGETVRELVLVEEDSLLEPGRKYMLVTSKDPVNGWHQIVAPGKGNERIDKTGELEELEGEFEQAEKEQVDPRPSQPTPTDGRPPNSR